MSRRGLVLAMSLVAACGDSTASDAAPDAAPDGGTDSGTLGSLPSGAALAGAAEAAPPVLTPCPPGFREVVLDGSALLVCEPYPVDGRAACGAGEGHFPGEAGCAPVGATCPPDRWPADLPARGVVYVDASAAAGGDGSRAAPLQNIEEAVAVVTAGDVIAVAKGDYDEGFAVPSGVTLRGACASETHITQTSSGPTIVLDGTGTVLENVTVSGIAQGVVAGPGSSVAIRGVVIDGATTESLRIRPGATADVSETIVRNTRGSGPSAIGVVVELTANVRARRLLVENNVTAGVYVAGTLELTDSLVSNTAAFPGLRESGAGIYAYSGGVVRAERVLVEGSHWTGVVSLDGSMVTLSDCLVMDTLPASTGTPDGWGVAADGGSVSLVRTRIGRSIGAGVIAAAASEISLADVVVHDSTRGEFNTGIHASGASTVNAERVLVRAIPQQGVWALGDGTSVRLTDVSIADVGTLSTSIPAAGLFVTTGASASVERVRIERVHFIGAYVEQGGSLAGGDVVVDDVLAETASVIPGTSSAFVARLAGTIDLSRVSVSRYRGWGMISTDEGSLLTLRDLHAFDGLPKEGAPLGGTTLMGRALDVQDRGAASIERGIIEGARSSSVFVWGGARLDMRDTVVRDTLPDEFDQGGGRGIEMQLDASADLELVRFEGNRDVAVAVYESTLDMREVEIVRTLPAACGDSACTDDPGGIGIGSYGSRVTATSFLVDSNYLIGVQLAFGGEMDLSDGVVSGSMVGANVQVPDFDISRLQSNVRYVDNGVNFDGETLPVPEADPTL